MIEKVQDPIRIELAAHLEKTMAPILKAIKEIEEATAYATSRSDSKMSAELARLCKIGEAVKVQWYHTRNFILRGDFDLSMAGKLAQKPEMN